MLQKPQNLSLSTEENYQHQNEQEVSGDTSSLVPSLSQMEDKINQKSPSQNYSYNFFPEDFIHLVKRRWTIVAGVTCAITAIVGWWIFQQSPVYQGKFMLLLEKQTLPNNNNNQFNNNNNLNNNLNNNSINAQVDYSTEIQILGSPSVIAPILEDISREYPDIYDDISFVDLNNLEINQINNTRIIEVIFQDENPEKVKFVLDKISQKYLDKNFNLLQGNHNEGLKFVQSQTSKVQKKVDFLQDKLQKLREQYRLIDPQITAQELTQQFLVTEKEYFQAQTQLEQANNTYNYLQQQLNLTPEEAIAVTSLTESKRYQSLLQQLEDIDIELAKQSAIFTDVSPIIIDLREKRENIIQLLQEETEKFAVKPTLNNPNNSAEIVLNAPSKIRSQLIEELLNQEREIKTLTTQVKNIQQVLEKLNDKVAQMPIVTRKYSDLQRELDVSIDSLTRLLKTQETLEIQKAQNTVNWEIISPPQLDQIPTLPFSPHNLIFAVLGGFSLGTISAIIVDELDNTIQSVTALKKITSQPILGYIPENKQKDRENDLISHNLSSENRDKNHLFFEQIDHKVPQESTPYWSKSFSDLYTNLHLLKSNHQLNSIVISSADSVGGKSNTSLRLAQISASMGQRILLIDSNLKTPQINELLNVENNYGFSDILTNKIDLFSSIKTVSQWDNLSVITTGQVPTDVTRLLLSSNIKKIINDLSTSSEFDLIIYDTPSILDFADPKIIASHTDGLILVVQLGKTKKNALKQVSEQLEVANIPLLGIIINEVKHNSLET